MYNELEVIQPIINWHKIKYKTFSKLIMNSRMEGNKVNMFINLDSILNLFYTDKLIPAVHSLKHLENIVLTAEVINIIAHYRHFFWKSFNGVPTRFFIYSCNKVPKFSKKINENYMSTYIKKIDEDNIRYGEVNKIINVNKELLNLISLYVQDAYFIESNGLEPSLIPYKLINKYGTDKNICNIIMTNDKYEYQLTNLKNTFIIRPRGDKSKIIGKEDIYNHKFKDIKYRPGNIISPRFYPFVLAMDGYKKRNIEKVKGYSFVKTMKLIETMIFDKRIKNDKISNPDTYLFKDYLNDNQIETLLNNLKCTDLGYLDKVIDDKLFDSKIKLINRYDNKAIMELNSEYFPNNNIQLIELCEGVGLWNDEIM